MSEDVRISRRALLHAAAVGSALPAIGASAAGGEPLRLERGPHLFVDDYLIAEQAALRRRVSAPSRLPHPVITGPEDHNFQPYVTVLRDPETRRFRVWYGVPTRPGEALHSHLAYLEGEDGIHWKRPHRILADPEGVEVRFGASVLDEGPDYRNPEQRYKVGFCAGEFSTGGDGAGGLMVAVSPDGLAWKPISPRVPVLRHSHDINNIAWDPIRGRYLATISQMRVLPGEKQARRVTQQSASTDLLHWSEPWDVLTPDAQDQGDTQFYAMSGYQARGGLLIGLVKVLRDDLPADAGGERRGIGYTTLAWTRDGKNWTRDREPFLDRSPASGAFDHAMTWGDCQLPVDDEVFFYYGGYARGHKVERFTERQIGLARMPRDRYVAREAGGERATLRTPPLVLPRGRRQLTVNAVVRGEMRVRVLDGESRPHKGRDWTDCQPLHGDSLEHLVRWKRAPASLPAGPIRLEFALQDASIYGFDLPEVST